MVVLGLVLALQATAHPQADQDPTVPVETAEGSGGSALSSSSPGTLQEGGATALVVYQDGLPMECIEQEPQAFLIRGNFIVMPGMSDEERDLRRQAHENAIRYRTEQYGYFEGFGEPSWNDTTPLENADYTTFMGHRVRVNRRIIPALACVEAEIARSCAHVPYVPERITGLRTRNTYHTGEVSNHVYGIAIDIDSHRNTCCHCVARWRDHPLCRIEVDSIFERMAMPECWVHAFERYGFYWLGWDQLEDTMHFEFLGNPDRILRPPGAIDLHGSEPPEHIGEPQEGR